MNTKVFRQDNGIQLDPKDNKFTFKNINNMLYSEIRPLQAIPLSKIVIIAAIVIGNLFIPWPNHPMLDVIFIAVELFAIIFLLGALSTHLIFKFTFKVDKLVYEVYFKKFCLSRKIIPANTVEEVDVVPVARGCILSITSDST